jgi:hypothetical protein
MAADNTEVLGDHHVTFNAISTLQVQAIKAGHEVTPCKMTLVAYFM